jgi:hypothetical protein
MKKALSIGVAIVFFAAACGEGASQSTRSGNYYSELEQILTDFQTVMMQAGELAIFRLPDQLDGLHESLSELDPPAGAVEAHIRLLDATEGIRAAFTVTLEGQATPTTTVPEPTPIQGGAFPAFRAACFDLQDLAASAGTVIELNCASPFGDGN